MRVRVRPRPRIASRLPSLAFSYLVHAAILLYTVFGPPLTNDQPYPVYRKEILPNEKKLIWYSFKTEIPNVSPSEPRRAGRPRVELKMPGQTIISEAPKAPGTPQMIWRPAPRLQFQQDLKSPNLLAFRAPVPPPMPARPRPKLFAPPPEAARTAAPAPALPAAPQLSADARTAAGLAPRHEIRITRPAPKRFAPPPEAPRPAPGTPLISAAPQIAAQAQPPKLAMPLPGSDIASLAPVRPPPRQFVPPSAAGTMPGPAEAVVPAPQPSDAQRMGAAVSEAGLTAAIIGVNPVTRTEIRLPEGSRPAGFSAGPEPNSSGTGDGGSVPGAQLSVPGLTVQGGKPGSPADSRPVLLARAAPTSAESLRAALRTTVRDPAPPTSAAIRVASAPDPRFHGRAVYALSVQMPNITSYIGSWMLWFAVRGGEPGDRSPIEPPMPLRKVDPKYLPSAVDERVEGRVRLMAVIGRGGRVESVALVKSVDARLDRSAEEAIRKWEFTPARRNGVAVEVDALVEIPFLLGPRGGK